MYRLYLVLAWLYGDGDTHFFIEKKLREGICRTHVAIVSAPELSCCLSQQQQRRCFVQYIHICCINIALPKSFNGF